jgi:hypothetical protein
VPRPRANRIDGQMELVAGGPELRIVADNFPLMMLALNDAADWRENHGDDAGSAVYHALILQLESAGADA